MYTQGRKFLVVTKAFGSVKRAIPIECITQICEVQDENQTDIEFYNGKEKIKFWVKESFKSIMAGDCTMVL